MIDGVKIKNLTAREDIPDQADGRVKPGFLMEILRADEEIFTKFGQSTLTVAYEGTVKGFHIHEKQDDMWFAATGKIMIMLYDLRPASSTYKKTEVLHAGENDYKLLVIPPGVAHGYKVLSKEPVLLFYHTTEPYNASHPDEKRRSLDDSEINFDWSKYARQ